MGKRLINQLSNLFSITDEQAMWRVQMNDDPAAFARLMERWQGPVRRLCERMTGDSHRAEDLAQETFVRVFARRKDYVASSRFSTFLWRVALNLCYDELRRIRRRRESPIEQADELLSEEAALIAPEMSPDDQAAISDQAEIVRKALQQLPDPYRTVVVLRHYENLKFREIADVLEIPEGTVKSRMAEAMSQLSRLLDELQAPSARANPRVRKESLII